MSEPRGWLLALRQMPNGLLVFSGIGLGLARTFSPLETTGLAVLVFAAQLAISAWWLRRYRYGPGEWLLRWVTNGRRPAWVVARPAATMASHSR